MKKITLILVLLLQPIIGFSQQTDSTIKFFLTGNDLYHICSKGLDNNIGPFLSPEEQLTARTLNIASFANCSGYIMGVTDQIAALQAILGMKDFCIIDRTRKFEIGQLIDIVFRYLLSHPEKRDYKAANLVVEALSAAFPCHS